jgi:hypothetical protein
MPKFVDIEDQTYTLDQGLLERAITPKTKAIITVHLFGQVADMYPIMEISRRRGLFVVEDACQAHGATYQGRRVGAFGVASCFSFYPGKNLGAFGEGGAVATDDAHLAVRIRRLRDHGQTRRYEHAEIGYNARMEGIQGAVLTVKLRHLDDWLDRALRDQSRPVGNDLLGSRPPPGEARDVRRPGEDERRDLLAEAVDRRTVRRAYRDPHLDLGQVGRGLVRGRPVAGVDAHELREDLVELEADPLEARPEDAVGRLRLLIGIGP